MKTLPFAPVNLLQNSKFCLFGIAVGLTTLHSISTWRLSGDSDRLIINVLLWGAILCLLWRKRDAIDLESGVFSSFFGSLLIALVLFKSISLFWFETSFLKAVPLLLSLGLGLLASGIKGLKQYWRELLIVLLLCLPDTSVTAHIIQELFKVSILTAKFAIFFLWYLGFEVTGSGADIILPNGSVWVGPDCTGINTALLLLKLAVVFILVFPSHWSKKILLPLGAVLISFIASGIRVAIMAVVVSDRDAFQYWHGPEGNQIFSTASILLFGLFCRFMRSADKSEKLASPDVELQP